MCRGRYLQMVCGMAFILTGTLAVEADITTGLVGYWPLNGHATDFSGNNLHGTINGDVTPAPDRMGYPDSAMMFPGDAGANVTIGDRPELQITGEMTLAAWVFLNSANQNNGRIIAKRGGGGSRSWNLNIEASSGGVSNPATFQISLNPDDSVSVNDTQSLPTDEWAHVAGVFRPAEAVAVYVNGQLRASVTQNVPSSQFSDNGLPVMIGARSGCSNCGWDGLIDEARIYQRALSTEDLQELHEFVPSPRYQAWGPDPADGAPDVVVALLTWHAGVTAILHDVYFGTDPNLGPDDLVQSHLPMAMYYHVPGLTPGTTYYWRVDEIEADMATVHTGDVWTFMAQPVTAYRPDPADGANEVAADPNVTLTWRPGLNAREHHVYFGDSFADVNEAAADTDKGTMTETSFAPGSLLPLTTYYWRVDELALDESVRAGQVWSFTTFGAVDDFESYTDDVDAGQAVFQTWIDGVDNGTGSYVGYEVADNGTFGETAIVNSGGQSMPLEYDNAAAPYYSETERTWDAPQDWTANEVDTIVLHVRGRSGNDTEPLYVALQDSAGRIGVVVHPDVAVVTTIQWTPWRIPLSEFGTAGVNLAAIKKMYIGLGDRNAPTPGGAGLIFVDDIRLTRPAAPQ